MAQFDTIKKIADEGPCVIVGRCADYALNEYRNCVHLFIYGDLETKIRRIMKRYDLTEAKAKDMIIKKINNARVIIIIILLRNGGGLTVMIYVLTAVSLV